MSLLLSAQAFARMGYRVFTCWQNTRIPSTQHGQLDATTDIAIISEWWRRSPASNIAISTDGMVVIDVDGKSNAWPHDATIRDALMTGVAVSTPHGHHYYFKSPPGVNIRTSQSRIAPHVDVRAHRSCITVPPSGIDGLAYQFEKPFDVRFENLPILPDALIRLCASVPVAKVVAIPRANCTDTDIERRARAYLATMPGAVSGQGGHNACYTAARVLVNDFALPQDVALRILREDFNPRCTPIWSEKELTHKIKSASETAHSVAHGALVNESQNEQAVDLSAFSAPSEVPCAIIIPDADDANDAIESAADTEYDSQIPNELLRVPGFISRVMEFCLETAPCPNPTMSFCGALALQAFLAGRKVRDEGDNRTNLYILGLANSGTGKDWPRKINMRIAHAAGLGDCIGERFASGEGVQDALFLTPNMLFQTDEMDGVLQSINNAKDSRHEIIMDAMRTLYSSANSIFPMRRKAGQESAGVIDQPCLSVFGTAIPNHYYEALSERMLTNGFFSRMLIFESGKRAKGRDARIADIPADIAEIAQWWARYTPGTGDLAKEHPSPRIVATDADAKARKLEIQTEIESEYASEETRNNADGMAVWARANEQMCKLALIYAISSDCEEPVIGVPAVDWATKIVMRQIRGMLNQTKIHVSENPFHKACLKVRRKLQSDPLWTLSHSVLLKRMKIDARSLQQVISTMAQSGEIEIISTPTKSVPHIDYRLKNS